MPFNIKTFKANINDFGYVKNNKFEVFVQAPKFLQGKKIKIDKQEVNFNDLNKMMRFRIDQVKSPSVSLMSIDTNRYGIGPTQKMPFNALYYDTSFYVLLDKNTHLWDFWYNWTNGIFNFNGQEPNGNNLFLGGRIPNYTVEYKDEYTSTMVIVIYNDVGEIVKTINLYDAFPSHMREVLLRWNDNADLMRLILTITYSSYSIVGTNVLNTTDATGASEGALLGPI